LDAANVYVQEVVELIGYAKSDHILAITGRNDLAISVNLGQWLVLGFQRRSKGLNALFAIDCTEGMPGSVLNV
jgi:hypothetical protein